MPTKTPPPLRRLTGAETPETHHIPPGYEQGPLIVQPAPAARVARILHNAAMELWDAAALEDPAWMWEEARAIASRVLASCPTEPK